MEEERRLTCRHCQGDLTQPGRRVSHICNLLNHDEEILPNAEGDSSERLTCGHCQGDLTQPGSQVSHICNLLNHDEEILLNAEGDSSEDVFCQFCGENVTPEQMRQLRIIEDEDDDVQSDEDEQICPNCENENLQPPSSGNESSEGLYCSYCWKPPIGVKTRGVHACTVFPTQHVYNKIQRRCSNCRALTTTEERMWRHVQNCTCKVCGNTLVEPIDYDCECRGDNSECEKCKGTRKARCDKEYHKDIHTKYKNGFQKAWVTRGKDFGKLL